MANKKSQITIFIIIGVILIFAIFLYLNYFNKFSKSEPDSINTPDEFMPVKSFIDSCLKSTAEKGTKILTEYGGRIERLVFDDIPGLKEMENDLSLYINENIDTCINSFEELKAGFEITGEKHSVETTINKDDITFILDYPLVINTKDSTKNLDKFPYSYHGVNIPYLRELSLKILEDEEWLNWLSILNELEKNDIYMNITTYDNLNFYSLNTEIVRFNFGESI